MIWFICLVVLAAILLWTAKQYGPHIALAVTTLSCLLFPFWVLVEPYGIEIHLNVAAGVAALGLYCVHPKSFFRTRLVLLDYIMIAMVVINATSDVMNSGWRPYILLQIYGEWFVAYVVGRLSLASFGNLRDLQSFATIICMILAVCGIFECLSSINIFQTLLAEPSVLAEKFPMRWDHRRASGPTDNPIYFGVLLFLLAPWAIQYSLAKYEESREHHWLLLIGVMLAGIFSSLSRAPVLAMALLPIGPLFLFVRSSRIPIIVGSVVLVAIAFFAQDQLILMMRSVGEAKTFTQNSMVLDGQKIEGSAAGARFYLWDYYRAAVRKAGLFGYGSNATSTFPPQVPAGGNNDLSALRNLRFIDNQFLLFILRFGYLGATCWACALACTAWNFGYLAIRCPIDLKWFCASCLSVIVGIVFIQCTVWMPQDYGFYLVWLMGASAGLLSALYKRLSELKRQSVKTNAMASAR